MQEHDSEPIDYQKILEEELQLLFGGGVDAQKTPDPEISKALLECCWRPLDECQCISTSSKEDEGIFTGSTYSLEEYAVTKHVMQLVSTPDILSVLFTDITYGLITTEYTWFLTFLLRNRDPDKSDLASLILPVTIHFYALMIQSDCVGVHDARRFLDSQTKFLHHVEGYEESLAALRTFKDIDDLKQDSKFQLYFERKTIVKISRDAFESLQNFLKSIKNCLKHSILLSVLAFNIDFLDCNLCDCPAENEINEDGESSDLCDDPSENKINEDGESSGDSRKNETDVEGTEELKHVDQDLKNIEIWRIFISPKKPEHLMTIYDLDNEEKDVMDDVSDYTEPKKKPKIINVKPKPLPVRNSARTASKRFAELQKQMEKLEVDAKQKKANLLKANLKKANLMKANLMKGNLMKGNLMKGNLMKGNLMKGNLMKGNLKKVDLKKVEEVEPDSSLRSLHSVEFNCAMSEITYATGDNFIYTLPITTPDRKKKKTINFMNDATVVLQTYEHNKSGLKSTKVPDEENVFVVKYLQGEPITLLAACSLKVRLFNTKTCSFLAEYVTDCSFIYDIDVDSTGQYFATANHFLASYIYTYCFYSRVVMLTGHEKAVTAVKFHPNGIYVATGSEDCTVRMFEVESGDCVRLFVGHVFGVWMMDISYDGNLIASADSSGLVKVWDIKDCALISKKDLRLKDTANNVINSLCFHENSLLLAACNEKNEVVFWDARNSKNSKTVRCVKKPMKIQPHIGKGWNIVFQPPLPI